ncbi:MAG: serine protein kinase, partial [Planctomycetaceae bacterium]|nr:serine protein kinase [Planctomycetaceae bacterium]
MVQGSAFLQQVSAKQDADQFRTEHWQGSFAEYLDLVRERPEVTRTAYQRLYDMVIADGQYAVEGSKNMVRYKFFDDPHNNGADAIFGLTRTLMELVNVFKSAALGYGTER